MAARTFQQDIQHDYEAFLIYSLVDENLAKAVWQSLKNKGLNITQHRDPDGPFQYKASCFDNMVNAIEKSEKVLVLFTKAAVDSGFVSLEMMLALEKSQRTGQLCLYLIAVGLQEDEICALKHGLLGSVPHIPVNFNRENWEENLLEKLRAPRECMKELLPAGSLAHGQVFSHFVGYLQYILPDLPAELKKQDIYQQNPDQVCLKYMMLIPYSCNTEIPLEETSRQSGISIKHIGNLQLNIVHGEKRRQYNPSIYKATKTGEKPIYFVGEFPKVLYSAYQLKEKKIAAVDTYLEANRFYFTMNNMLNHHHNSSCNDKAVLLQYPDQEVAVGEVLWSALSEEIQRGQHDRTSIAREMSYLKNMHERQSGETFEYDATISCLSDSPHDKTVAEKIASYLETHGKKVVTRSDDAGCWSELAKAQWNIFIMSQDSFKGDQYKIELISAIQRCAANRCIQMLPVITGIRMDEVPNALKWVTMISTEQHNYDEIILDQMEGKVVHMQEKMPAGDVSTGLSWAYLLNYLPIPLGDKTETDLDFHGRIQKHLRDRNQNCGCLPFFYVILSSTGAVIKLDTPESPIIHLGRAEPPVLKHQAGTKAREYYINMYKYKFPDSKEVCFISEACTPGITLHDMATEFQYAGIEPGEILRNQIKKLADALEEQLHYPSYIMKIGDFTKLFRLIRYDMDTEESIHDCVSRHLRADLERNALVHQSDGNQDQMESPMEM